MPDTADEVQAILEKEFALRVTLERGLMNRSALCRWLIKNYDLDSGVDAIDRVLQEWDGKTPTGPLQAARQAFAHVTPKGNYAVSVHRVKRSEGVHNALGDLFDATDGEEEDAVYVIPDGGEFLVVLDRDHAEEAREILGPPNVTKQHDDFRLVQIGFQGPNPGAAGAAITVSALASCDIEVRYVMTAATEEILLLHEADVGDAFGIIQDLKHSISGPVEGADEA